MASLPPGHVASTGHVEVLYTLGGVRAGQEWPTHRRNALTFNEEVEQYLVKLATGAPLATLLHDLVCIMEDQCPDMMGLILLLDRDGEHLHHGGSSQLPEEYVQSIEGLRIGPLVGSCGTASYLGQRVIVEDIRTDPRWQGLRALALKYDLLSCWSQPVFSSSGSVIGTFAMYYRQPRTPTEAELDTIKTAAHLAGIAIEHERTREELFQAHAELEQRVEQRTAELKNAQEALRESEKKYRDLVEGSSSIILEMDPSGNIIFFNRYAREFFGFPDDDILGRSIIGTIVPSVDSYGHRLDEFIHDLLNDPDSYGSSENENVRANGERVWIAWTNRALRDEHGRVSRILCFGIDRTEQRQMQEALTYELTEKAALGERNRLARELHDAVSQTLFSINLICESLPRLWERDLATAHSHIEEVRQLSRGALAEMRSLLLELRPAALEEAPLADLLRHLADSVTHRYDLPVRVAADCEPDVSSAVKIAAYRIAQEALNNVVKHAGASSAHIELQCDREEVRLIVGDDGNGFQADAVPSDALGLGIMRERATSIGGSFTIVSTPSHGTEVRVTWKSLHEVGK